MKDIIPEVIEYLIEERDRNDRLGMEYIALSFISAIERLSGISDEEIKNIVVANFGDVLHVSDHEVVYNVTIKTYRINEGIETIKKTALELQTKVAVISTTDVTFYYDPRLVTNKDSVYLLNSFQPGTWDDYGMITINPDRIDIANETPNRLRQSSFSHTPLHFANGNQYKVRKTYFGTLCDERSGEVEWRFDTEHGRSTPNDKLPLCGSDSVDAIAEYNVKAHSTNVFHRIFGVVKESKSFVWGFKKSDFHRFTGYIPRVLVGDAVKFADQYFNTFNHKEF